MSYRPALALMALLAAAPANATPATRADPAGPPTAVPRWVSQQAVDATAVAGCGDREVALTGSADGEIRVWDTITGHAIDQIELGSSRHVLALACSHRGPWIFAAYREEQPSELRIVRIDLTRGEPDRTLSGNPASYFGFLDLAVSPDDRFVMLNDGGSVTVWRAGGELLGAIRSTGRGASFDDEGHLVFQDGDGIKVLDLDRGEIVAQTAVAPAPLFSVSADGAWVSQGWDSSIDVRRAADGELVATHGVLGRLHRLRFRRGDGALYASTVRGSGLFRISGSGWSERVHLGLQEHTGDFDWVGSEGVLVSGRQLKVWSFEPFVERVDLGRRSSGVRALALAPDGRLLAAGFENGQVRLWDLDEGLQLTLNYHPRQLEQLPFEECLDEPGDEDHRQITQTFTVGGRQEPTVAPFLRALAFDPAGRTLLVAHAEGPVEIWDVESLDRGRILVGAPPPAGPERPPPPSVAGAALGSTVAAAIVDREVRIWHLRPDPATSPPHRIEARPDAAAAVAVAVRSATGDEEEVVLVHPDRLATFDPRSTTETWSVRGDFGYSPLLAVEESGAIVVRRGDDLCRYQPPGTEPDCREGLPGDAQALVTAAGGWYVGTSRGQLWRLGEGAPQDPHPAHPGFLSALAAQGQDPRRFPLLVSAGWDGTLRFWQTPDLHPLAVLEPTGDEGWLAVDPRGRFDGNPAGWAQARFKVPERPWQSLEPEQLFATHFRPGLLGELGRDDDGPVAAPEAMGQPPEVRFLTPPSVRFGPSPGSEGELLFRGRPETAIRSIGSGQLHSVRECLGTHRERTLTVRLRVESRGSGVRACRMFNNRSLLRRLDLEIPPGQPPGTAEIEVPVRLQAGRNRVSAYCFDYTGVRSPEAVVELLGDRSLERQGRAWVITIGVDAYDRRWFRPLNFAVRDAEHLGARLLATLGAGGSFDPVLVHLPDALASRATIVRSLEILGGSPRLSNEPPALARLAEVEPEDAVIFFFAGHGVARDDRLHLIPVDFAGWNASPQTLTDRDLERLFDSIASPRIALIFDACRSGQALEAEEPRRGPLDTTGLAQLAYEKGMMILAASQAYGDALERAVLGHGVLTSALLELLDKAPVGTLTAADWLRGAQREVPSLLGRADVDARSIPSGPARTSEERRGMRPTEPPQPLVQVPALYVPRGLDPDLFPLRVEREDDR